ncbi:hypothetical protein [Nocardia blacklockiae]|uniref:hypothetical protein n=1 Tax=Nocardia blacklockiae TaxID=480036 RepID=UPI001892D88E|nr:hypothetical protein [Nocardia blacklockiae]MBF6172314.1 hypothetical protein [Nocardia blacklockiae]
MVPGESALRRIEWLFEFRVAMAALGGALVFGAAAITALHSRAWVAAVLFAVLATPCALIVVLNIVLETVGYALTWLIVAVAVVLLPLLPIPEVRRWLSRIWLRRHGFGPSPTPPSRAAPHHR